MGWSFYNSDGQILQGVLAGATLTIPVITEIDSGSTITLDATTDIVLDADGADILLKDGGTDFGGFTNTSGNLIIKSGTTTAMTFSGANATLAGNLTVSGTTTQIDSTTLTVADTLIKLNQAYTGTAYDIGLVFTRGKLGVLGKLEIREQQKMPEPELQKINTFVLLQNTQNV